MKVVTGVLSLLVAGAAIAQPARQFRTELERVEGPSATVGDVVRAAHAQAVRPQSVITENGTSSFLIAVAINSPGKNGTFFRTDVFLTNNRGIDQEILVGFLPAGVPGAGQGLTRYRLNALTVYSLRDFLGSGTVSLNKSGVGALMVTAVFTGTNSEDSLANIDGADRIWTFESGTSAGTNSFTMSSTAGSVSGTPIATAVGLRQDAGFRSNVGIVNFDSFSSHTWTVRAVGDNQTSFTDTVPALSKQQVAGPPGVTGDLFVEYTPDFGSFFWSAYGVTADNLPGDAWSARANQ
jgi:hypothetical protein